MDPSVTDWYFNPIMFEIGPFKAHWYGFMYAATFILGYLYLHRSAVGEKMGINTRQKDGLILWCILGIILGGRLGYVILYNFAYYFANPVKIFAVWEGGMASHGAVIGSVLAVYWYCRRHNINILKVTDAITSYVPVGIILIRLGNFINGELYGRIAEKYCIYFPADPENCRYPSQLFQAFLEGLILLIILQIVARKSKNTGFVTGLFFVLYGLFRIIGELFREPDAQIGYYFGMITQGQILSGIMVLAGLILLVKTKKKWYNNDENRPSKPNKHEPHRETHEHLQKSRQKPSRRKTKKSEGV
ncbi:MAG TPA: prolipoprotein diacylglyceryl transferase [Candidatus Gracilibacteria bacterium]|nr:prolipoprotein diacylglyceryl transferase [Candidatus Gracilibacteria bacterium]